LSRKKKKPKTASSAIETAMKKPTITRFVFSLHLGTPASAGSPAGFSRPPPAD
jgi:hypothetical protein